METFPGSESYTKMEWVTIAQNLVSSFGEVVSLLSLQRC